MLVSGFLSGAVKATKRDVNFGFQLFVGIFELLVGETGHVIVPQKCGWMFKHDNACSPYSE